MTNDVSMLAGVTSLKCDSCGHEMGDPKGALCVGTHHSVTGDHPEVRRWQAMFGKENVYVCWCCMTRALGVKPAILRAIAE